MSKFSKRIIPYAAVALVMMAGSVLLAARSFGRPARNVTTSTAQELSAVTPTEQVDDADEKGIWVLIRPEGFAVQEWNLAAGDYFVVVQNASGLKELSITIERLDGTRVQDVQFDATKKLWKQNLQLTTGTYVVRENNHPEWTARITVE